jgi:hypothetical protein
MWIKHNVLDVSFSISLLNSLQLILGDFRMFQFLFVIQGIYPFCVDSLVEAPCAMVSFYPDFRKVEGSVTCGEFVFLVDCSTRMGRTLSDKDGAQLRIEVAKVISASFLCMGHMLM